MSDRERSGALSLGLTQARRQLGSQPAVVATLFISVLVAAFLLGATPRLLEEVSSEDLAATVSEPAAANRNIAVERLGRFAPGPLDDPLLRISEFGERFAENEIPPSIQEIISDSYFLFESPQFTIGPVPGEDPPNPFDLFMRFTYLENIEDEMELIDGDLPQLREPVPFLVGSACPSDPEVRMSLFEQLEETGEPLTDDSGIAVDCAIGEVNHYEIVVSGPTAAALEYELGRRVLLTPNTTDSAFLGLPLEDLTYSLMLTISGIVEFSDPESDYWYGRNDLHQPVVEENPDFRFVFAKGVMNPDAYADLFSDLGLANFRYTYRHFVSAELIQDSDLDTLVADLREFQNLWTPVSAIPSRPRVITQLPDLLDAHLDQRSETVAVMSTTVASLFVVSVAVILLLAVLMTSRQRVALVYSRNRGASRSQMVLTRIYEGVVLTVPAAILGYLIAGLIYPESEDLTAYRIDVALAAAAITMVVAASWRVLTSPLGPLQKENLYGRPKSTRRLVAEILVITLAAGSVILLRRRGSIDDPTAELASFDWLLAAAPALLSVSVALVTIWLFPLVISLLSWLAGQLRGLLGFIGFKRLLNQNANASMALGVVLICVATAVFASIASTSVDEGQEVSSFQQIGADYTVVADRRHANLPGGVNLAEADGVEASALATTFDRARLQRDVIDLSTEVMAIDGAAYLDVRSGTAGAFDLPSELTGIPQPGEGTEEAPMPAIVAETWPAGFAPQIGDVYTIDLGSIQPVVEIVEVRSRFPDLPTTRPFVVVNRSALESFSDIAIPPTAQFLRAAAGDAESLTSALADQSGFAQLRSRFAVIDDLSADPFVEWVERGFFTVFVFAGVLAVVAAVSSLVLASAQRRIDFAYLKTLGLDNGQATVLTILEQLPIVLSATAVGALTGVGVAVALDPAIELDAFTGDLVPTAVTIDWLSIVLLAVALFAALSAAIVIFVLATRSQDIGRTLRVGDE